MSYYFTHLQPEVDKLKLKGACANRSLSSNGSACANENVCANGSAQCQQSRKLVATPPLFPDPPFLYKNQYIFVIIIQYKAYYYLIRI